MDKTEIYNKLQYVLKGIELNEDRKRILNEVIMDLYDFADKGQNPDMTKYVLKDEIPSATANKIGGIKSQTAGTTANRDYPVEVAADGKAKVNVPWTDTNTTYAKATTSADGLMSKEDKSKLDGLILVPTGGTDGQVLKKTSSGVAWQADSNTTYSAANASTLGLVKQGATVAALEAEDEIATVIARVNTLIANLKTAGIIANS